MQNEPVPGRGAHPHFFRISGRDSRFAVCADKIKNAFSVWGDAGMTSRFCYTRTSFQNREEDAADLYHRCLPAAGEVTVPAGAAYGHLHGQTPARLIYKMMISSLSPGRRSVQYGKKRECIGSPVFFAGNAGNEWITKRGADTLKPQNTMNTADPEGRPRGGFSD